MTIMVPANTFTDLNVQLISSITVDNGTNNSYSLTIAQFYKPTVFVGSNYNYTVSSILPQLTSSTGTSQVSLIRNFNSFILIFKNIFFLFSLIKLILISEQSSTRMLRK